MKQENRKTIEHCLIFFYHNKYYDTGSIEAMQVGEEIKISDKEELQHIWETLKEDPELYFENLFEEDKRFLYERVYHEKYSPSTF